MLSLLKPSKILQVQEVCTDGMESSSTEQSCQDLNTAKKRVRVLNPKQGPKRLPDNVKCDICGKVISFRRNLARHMSTYHKEAEESFNCLICNSTYNSQYHLDRHTESKNCLRNLKFECRKCKKMFTSAEKLSVHSEKNCNKKFMCTSCFCYFKSKKEYKNHCRSHES